MLVYWFCHLFYVYVRDTHAQVLHQYLEINGCAVTSEDTLASIDKGEEALENRERDVCTDDSWLVVSKIVYQAS